MKMKRRQPHIVIHAEVITATDTTTVTRVTAYADSAESIEVETVGIARRDPTDHNDPDLGLQLALGRALRQAGRELLHDANKQVRHHARVKAQTQLDAERRRRERLARAAMQTMIHATQTPGHGSHPMTVPPSP